MRAVAEMHEWNDLEHHRLEYSLLVALLAGPTLSAIPIILFGLHGQPAVVAGALTVLLTGTATYARQTQRVLNGHRTVQQHLEQRVGTGPSLGELASWFPAFVDVDSDHYIVAIARWDNNRGDYRSYECAERLAREARVVTSSHFKRPIPVGWCWGEEEGGYTTWDSWTPTV